MKIVTINVNGIRSANSKGLFAWLEILNPDIICLQEIKAAVEDIPSELMNWNGYYTQYHPAQKKGYSGVAILARKPPQNVVVGLNHEAIDSEGRYLQFDYADFSVISLYLPSGSSGPDKQQNKFTFMDYYKPLLEHKLSSKRNYIICGDFNIAHQEIDLKNWKGNLKHSGFLKPERDWMSYLLSIGFVDVWRRLYPDIPGYTWWSNRGQAYNKDVGWRIDYQICTPAIGAKSELAEIYKQTKFSDHAPLIVDYDFNF
jgi:exodeoxyribonuclease-3